jgi:ribosomal protein S18 acetylase RimI-like enzyme
MLRHARATDYAACTSIFHTIFDITEDPRWVLAWKTRSPTVSFVVEEYGFVTGFAIVSKAGVLSYLCVAGARQGQGLGSDLVRTVTRSARATLRRRLRLTTANVQGLREWYERLGFRVVRTRTGGTCFDMEAVSTSV